MDEIKILKGNFENLPTSRDENNIYVTTGDTDNDGRIYIGEHIWYSKVDEELSEESSNPIANSAVTKEIIKNEKVTAYAFAQLQDIVGLDEHLNYDFSKAKSDKITGATSITDALNKLGDEIPNTSNFATKSELNAKADQQDVNDLDDRVGDIETNYLKNSGTASEVDVTASTSVSLSVGDNELSVDGTSVTYNGKEIATVDQIPDTDNFVTEDDLADYVKNGENDKVEVYVIKNDLVSTQQIEHNHVTTTVQDTDQAKISSIDASYGAVSLTVLDMDNDKDTRIVLTSGGTVGVSGDSFTYNGHNVTTDETTGILSSLTTTNKTNLVAAINEVAANSGGVIDNELSLDSANAVENSAITKVIIDNELVTAKTFKEARNLIGADENFKYDFSDGDHISQAKTVIEAIEMLDSSIGEGGNYVINGSNQGIVDVKVGDKESTGVGGLRIEDGYASLWFEGENSAHEILVNEDGVCYDSFKVAKVVNVLDYTEVGGQMPAHADVYIVSDPSDYVNQQAHSVLTLHQEEGETEESVYLLFCTWHTNEGKGEEYIVFKTIYPETSEVYHEYQNTYNTENVPSWVIDAFGENGGKVDTELSEDSPNAIANSAITKALYDDEKAITKTFHAVRDIIGTDEHLEYDFSNGTHISDATNVIEAIELLDESIVEGIAEAPEDGKKYARQDSDWVEIEEGSSLQHITEDATKAYYNGKEILNTDDKFKSIIETPIEHASGERYWYKFDGAINQYPNTTTDGITDYAGSLVCGFANSIGYGNRQSQNTLTCGVFNKVGGNVGLVSGSYNTINGDTKVCIGRSNYATSNNTFIIGCGNVGMQETPTTAGYYGIFGNLNHSNAFGSFTFGGWAHNKGQHALVFGDSIIKDLYITGNGTNYTINDSSVFSLGSAMADLLVGAAIFKSNITSTEISNMQTSMPSVITAIDLENNTLTVDKTLGEMNNTKVILQGTMNSGNNSVVFGSRNKGNHSTLFGTANENTAEGAVLIGYGNTNTGKDARLFGSRLTNSREDGVVLGLYNEGVANRPFVIGQGTSAARKDILWSDTTGDIHIKQKLYVGETNEVATKSELGTLTSLETASKSDLVAAINELVGRVKALEDALAAATDFDVQEY